MIAFSMTPNSRLVMAAAALLGFLAIHSTSDAQGNTAYGTRALDSNVAGVDNSAFGEDALTTNTTGSWNTALGFDALFSANSNSNTAVGATALYSTTSGSANTAVGHNALYSNQTGGQNTAVGLSALYNTTSSYNTAFGANALQNNTVGQFNVAIGVQPLFSNVNGGKNIALGNDALYSNENGEENIALGSGALLNNVAGADNTAVGVFAAESTTAGANTVLGAFAMQNNTSGGNNVVIGYTAGQNLTTGSGNIIIANPGVAGDASTIRIGTAGQQTQTFVAGIRGSAITGKPVVVDANGRLGVKASSARFKQQIKPIQDRSEVLLQLHPVAFQYKPNVDPEGVQEFGLIAEEVEKVDPDLVFYEDGKPFTVRYDAVNAMLLNEFLKQHRTVEEQQKQIASLNAAVKKQQALLEKVAQQKENKPTSSKTPSKH